MGGKRAEGAGGTPCAAEPSVFGAYLATPPAFALPAGLAGLPFPAPRKSTDCERSLSGLPLRSMIEREKVRGVISIIVNTFFCATRVVLEFSRTHIYRVATTVSERLFSVGCECLDISRSGTILKIAEAELAFVIETPRKDFSFC